MSQSDPNPYASPSIAAEALPSAAPIHGTIDYPLASRWIRLVGAIIDSLILLPLGYLAGYAVAAVMLLWMDESQFVQAAEAPLWQAAMRVLVGGGLFLAVNGYLLATRGQTVGKYLLKTQIVSDDGRVLPFWRLFVLRYLPFWLISVTPGIGWIVNLADSLAIFRESRRCFHDDFAGTKVIQL